MNGRHQCERFLLVGVEYRTVGGTDQSGNGVSGDVHVVTHSFRNVDYSDP